MLCEAKRTVYVNGKCGDNIKLNFTDETTLGISPCTDHQSLVPHHNWRGVSVIFVISRQPSSPEWNNDFDYL